MAYTKLFNSIITSTIWSEDDTTRIVWITMLAIADKNGEVQGSVPGLARIAGVDVDDCRRAIDKFLSPDPDSRTKDDEGRRIEPIDGGWLLLNHRKYREMASKDELKEAEAKRKARYRAKIARNEKSQNVPDKSQDVPKNPHIADSDSEADSYTAPSSNLREKKNHVVQAEVRTFGDLPIARPPATKFSPEFDQFWAGVPTKVGKLNAWKAWRAAIKQASADEIIAGLPSFVAYEAKRKAQDNGDYRALHPSTWLNSGRWTDEVEIRPDFSRMADVDDDENIPF